MGRTLVKVLKALLRTALAKLLSNVLCIPYIHTRIPSAVVTNQ